MALNPQDFPFGIMDVVELLHLNIRRRQTDSVYIDCPFCGDRRGKMNVNFAKNVWRCNYCGEQGGMLALYGRLNHISNSEAYREICDALQAGEISWGCERTAEEKTATKKPHVESGASQFLEEEKPGQASAQEIHQTYSLLLEMLKLSPAHQAHLRSEKRGLTEGQIAKFGFKSTPPYFLCRPLTERLIQKGCIIEGVPGFYRGEEGCWTVNFSSITSGILIPAIGIDGLIKGAQILLDKPLKNKDDPPGKSGAKYIWLSSSAKKKGTTSGSPVHFAGEPFARTVYITEGILKADIAYCLTGRSFMAVAGANNMQQLDNLFAILAQNGTEQVIEALDVDKYSNAMVAKGCSKIYLAAKKHGMECRRLTWNPNYKGIDDWQLALRREKEQRKERRKMDDVDGRKQAFRIYQLDFCAEQKTIPFAFRGIREMYKAGYGQPPAAEYRLVCEGSLPCPDGWTEKEILEEIAACYRAHMPETYSGRPLASSDIVELTGEAGRKYYYVDGQEFEPVRFSPFLAKPMKKRKPAENKTGCFSQEKA